MLKLERKTAFLLQFCVHTKSYGGDSLTKKNIPFEDKKGVESVKNQLIESYQSGVIEDKENLSNNRSIHTFNNQKK